MEGPVSQKAADCGPNVFRHKPKSGPPKRRPSHRNWIRTNHAHSATSSDFSLAAPPQPLLQVIGTS
eukprot:3587767-Alexandrium_andersonii.AAC.1